MGIISTETGGEVVYEDDAGVDCNAVCKPEVQKYIESNDDFPSEVYEGPDESNERLYICSLVFFQSQFRALERLTQRHNTYKYCSSQYLLLNGPTSRKITEAMFMRKLKTEAKTRKVVRRLMWGL